MIFREGTNKKGLTFFIVFILLIFVYLAWQSGDIVREENNVVLNPGDNYHVKLTIDNTSYDLWRLDNYLKFQQDEEVQFYFDSNIDNLQVYNKARLIAPTSSFNDLLIKYDPYQVVNEMRANISYVSNQSDRQFESELYEQEISIYLNDNDLPDTVLFDNSNIKIQYMYLSIGDTLITDVLPPAITDEN